MRFGQIQISTETVSSELLDEVESLFHRNKLDKTFSTWQFLPRLGREIEAVTARDKGVLVGFNATMPVTLSLNGDSVQEAIWSCDFIVDHKYRGKGLGSAIKLCLKDHFSMPIFALGISDQAMSVLQHSKWKTQVGLNVYNKLLHPQNNRQRVLFVLSMLSQFCSRKMKYQSISMLRPLLELPDLDDIELLWQQVKFEYGVCIARTGEYLYWRYGHNKSLNYQFLATYIQNKLSSLIVYRLYGDELKVVDYLGPILSSSEFLKLIDSLSDNNKINKINININQPKLCQGLAKLGFLKSRYFSNFAYFFNEKLLEQYDWMLTAGDSDGELISALKSDHTISLNDSNYRIETCDEADFLMLGNQWNRLLTNSNANPLFMSWHWCSTWWQTWKNSLNEIGETQLDIQLIYEKQNLVGILPLYRIKKKKLGCSYNEYHFLGNAWKIIPTVRSEYVSPILLAGNNNDLLHYFAQWFNEKAWNNVLVWPDSDLASLDNHFNCFPLSVDEGSKVDTHNQSFDQYKLKLGKNTRLKGINRQKLLTKEFPICEWGSYKLTTEQCDLFFEQLNGFHQERWKKDCFDEHALTFHKTLLNSALDCKAYLKFLSVENECISVQYNLQVNGTVYNLQAGFSSVFCSKYSLGTMHIMNSIQDSFTDDDCEHFDLLAGGGLNEQYKKHFKGEVSKFTTFLIFSNPIICKVRKMIFFIKVRLIKKLRLILNK